MIDGDLEHAVPVLQRTTLPFVARPARHPAFDNDVFATEGPVPVAACWSENRDNGCPGGGCEMCRTGIAADEKPGGFAKCNEFFERRWNLAHGRRFLLDAPD